MATRNSLLSLFFTPKDNLLFFARYLPIGAVLPNLTAQILTPLDIRVVEL